jgi:nucleoside-diphosphate-sugar epimerase
MSRRPLVVVTGAGGFVGQHTCDALRSAGWFVRAVTRAESPAVPGTERRFVRDLLDRQAVREACQGADAVVHLAARVHVAHERAPDPGAEFHRINVEGTRVVAEAARDAGAQTLVFVSSVAAVAVSSDTTLDASTVPGPTTPYGVSKLAAEAIVREVAARGPLAAAILRPPLVYGPGMKGNPLRLFGLVDLGVPLPLAGIANRRSVLFVGNLADAIKALLRSGIGAQGTYFVSDGQDLSTPEFARRIARALGKPARLVRFPAGAFRVAGRVGDRLKPHLPFPLDSGTVSRLLESLTVDPSPLTQATGYQPSTSVEEGLRQTADWYRNRHRGRQAAAS